MNLNRNGIAAILVRLIRESELMASRGGCLELEVNTCVAIVVKIVSSHESGQTRAGRPVPRLLGLDVIDDKSLQLLGIDALVGALVCRAIR